MFVMVVIVNARVRFGGKESPKDTPLPDDM
jgi:hypothetical protein